MEMCINAEKSVFDATTAFSYKFAINSPSKAEAYTLNNWPFGNKKQWKHNEPKSDLYTNVQFWKHLKQTATGHFSQQACRKREFNTLRTKRFKQQTQYCCNEPKRNALVESEYSPPTTCMCCILLRSPELRRSSAGRLTYTHTGLHWLSRHLN